MFDILCVCILKIGICSNNRIVGFPASLIHSKQPSPVANFSGQIESLQRFEASQTTLPRFIWEEKNVKLLQGSFGNKSLAATVFLNRAPTLVTADY